MIDESNKLLIGYKPKLTYEDEYVSDIKYTDNITEPNEDLNIIDEEIEELIEDTNEIDKLINSLPNKDYLDFNCLPDYLWNDSLLDKDKFYFHKELQLGPLPPTWDKDYPYKLEMKIIYTKEDIYNYFIKTFKLDKDLMEINKKKELGSIKYLLNEYKNIKAFDFLEPIDFILFLIDYVANLDKKINTILKLNDYVYEFAEFEKDMIINAKAANKNKIVWRQ